MKVLRGWVICHNARIRTSASDYRSYDYGWTRTEPIDKFLKDLGIEINGKATIQVVPLGDEVEIVWRAS